MSTVRRNWITAFYWIGVITTLGCFALVLAGNTELAWRFEHRAFPVSWVLAGAAVISFLAAEACHSVFSGPQRETEESPISAELVS
jgi:hypothetical protein